MKTLEELYNEIMENNELKEECQEAINAGRQEEFLKKHDCSATLEEAIAFVDAKNEQNDEISLDLLESAAGGTENQSSGGCDTTGFDN